MRAKPAFVPRKVREASHGAPKSLDGQKRAARDDNGKLNGCLSQTLRLVRAIQPSEHPTRPSSAALVKSCGGSVFGTPALRSRAHKSAGTMCAGRGA